MNKSRGESFSDDVISVSLTLMRRQVELPTDFTSNAGRLLARRAARRPARVGGDRPGPAAGRRGQRRDDAAILH
jgi:hypothetical protein